MSGQLAFSLSTWMSTNWDSARAWHYVCGLSLYVFFPTWSIGSGLQWCFWGKLSLLVRDWPVGIIKSKSACSGEALLWGGVVKKPSLSLLASWTWLTFHLGSSWSQEIFNWMESSDVFWREQRRYCLLKTKQVWWDREGGGRVCLTFKA